MFVRSLSGHSFKCLNRFQAVVALLLVISLALMGCSKVDELTETLNSQALHFASDSLLPAIPGQYYSATLVANGGMTPYIYSIQSGDLPAGLSLDTTTGAIEGVTDFAVVGSYSFQAKVVDLSGASSVKGFTVATSTALEITNDSLSASVVGVAYIETVDIVGGDGDYTYSASNVPSGFTLNPTTGVITGVSFLSGTHTIDFVVRDGAGLTAAKSLDLNITQPLQIATTSLAKGAVGNAYLETPVVTGGLAPYQFSVSAGSLPQGIGLNSGTAQISGTPEASGSAIFTFRVLDSLGQQATRQLTLDIVLGPKIVGDVDRPMRVAAEGKGYLDYVRWHGGEGSLSWTAVGLPSGLNMDIDSGAITGTPLGATAGTYNAMITVSDGNGISDSMVKTVRVVAAGLQSRFSGPQITQWGRHNAKWFSGRDMKVSDLNSDGIGDVAVVIEERGLIVFLGDGLGNFSMYQHDMPYRTQHLELVDIDGDGSLDAVMTNTADNRLTIVKGDDDWTNVGGMVLQHISLGSQPQQLAIGDLNGDAIVDIAVATYNNNRLDIMLICRAGTTTNYNGNPTQACNSIGQPITNYYKYSVATNRPIGVRIGDMDNNGVNDLVVGDYASSRAGIMTGVGDGTFNAITYQAVGGNVRHMKLADFNGDGNLDTAIGNHNSNIAVAFGDGAGGWLSSSNYSMTDVGGNIMRIDVGDVDGDGDQDIVAMSWTVHIDGLNVFFNDGTGGFSSRKKISVGYRSHAVALGQVYNSSTRLDLVSMTGNWVGHSRLLTFRNNNESDSYFGGIFLPTNPPSNSASVYGAPVAADLDRDGSLDIIAKVGGASSVLLGQGGGAFQLQASTIPTGDTGVYPLAADSTSLSDFNGDGFWDYVSANYNGGGGGTVSVSMGKGDGTFGSSVSFAVNQSGCTVNLGAWAVDTADFNKDGKVDILVGTGCSDLPPGAQAYIYWGNGDGTFDTSSPRVLTGNNNYVRIVKAVDVDLDGDSDVVLVDNGAWIRIYPNNGDGTFSAANKTALGIASNDIFQLAVGDLNNDGIPDYAATSSGTNKFAVAMGGANATFTVVNSFSGLTSGNMGDTAYRGTGVAITDWNQDGDLDVIWGKRMGGPILYEGDGSGSFSISGMFLTPNPSAYSDQVYSIYDIDGDGRPDLLNSNNRADGGSVGINLNKSQ